MYSSGVIRANLAALEGKLGLELREYSESEILEMSYRMKDIDWTSASSGELISTLPEEVQTYIFNELQRCKVDFLYWCRRYAKITDDRGRLSNIHPWPSQMALLDQLARMESKEWEYFKAHPEIPTFECKLPVVLLKSRQVGGTVISEALAAHLTIFFPHTRTIIGSDHPDNSLKLFRVFTMIVDNLPEWMKPRIDARTKAQNLHFPDLDSDVVVGSGNQKTTLGQGMTVDCAHLTELSTWAAENALAIDYDLKPAFHSSRKHHSLLIMESTGAGGKGNWFHDQFQAGRNPKSVFKSLFVGWFMCPDKWQMRADGVEIRPEISNLAERIHQEGGPVCTKEQLAWYQTMRDDYAVSGKLEIFLQEFPSSAEEAFQFGLKSVFPIEIRTKVRAKMREPLAVYDVNWTSQKLRKVDIEKYLADPDPEKADNRVILWELPRAGSFYVVGVDSSYGHDGGDSSAIEVVRVGTRFAPDEQVAEWRGNVPPGDLHIPCWILGHLYTDREMGLPALMAVECNPGSPGIVCQLDLQKRGYGNFYIYKRALRIGGGWSKEIGWWTTPQTRPSLTEKGVEAIVKGDLRVNSPGVLEEMASYVSVMNATGRRTLEHAPGYHDDRIMALFIANYVGHETDTVSVAEERRRVHEQRFEPPVKTRELQEMGLSWEEAIAHWENSLA